MSERDIWGMTGLVHTIQPKQTRVEWSKKLGNEGYKPKQARVE